MRAWVGDPKLTTKQGILVGTCSASAHRVPLVGDLGERCGAGRHEHLPDAVLKRLERLVVHAQERLPRRAVAQSAPRVSGRIQLQ